MTRTPAVLDHIAHAEIRDELNNVLKRVERVEAESAQRLANGEGSERPVQVVLMLFDGGDEMPAAEAWTPSADDETAVDPRS